jgi:molecular chaperone HtpG
VTTETTPPTASRETLRFQAEVNQVLHLVIHSLYSHKEVFLRELISNASDALDKLRFRATTEPDLLKDDDALEIRIIPDKDKGTITIEDTGVGMTRQELADNLGTIARSGSRAFLDALGQAGKSPRDVNLIGQFGVGFYSAYLVADHVEVVSRPAGGSASGASDVASRWISDAKDTFTLEPADRARRGTSVTLHLKEDQKHFLDEWQLRDLVHRYSDYVSHPIQLQAGPRGSDEVTPKLETINRASALWQRPKSEITDENYDDLYRHLTHDHQAPLARTHFRVEGTQEFVGLLFIPRARPAFDLHQGRRGVRLFVKRVFVMDDAEELLPEWMRFVRGVVDSDDLPLNVSREVLQDSAIVRAIRKQLTKKTLDLLEDMAKDKPEDYSTFWMAFGPSVKAGVHIDWENRERLARLARYHSTHGDELTSLADYVKRMPQGENGQDAIYYAVGDSVRTLASSPHLEAVRKKGWEVLYMTDPIDQMATESLGAFEGKRLVSVMQGDLKLGEAQSEEQKKAREETEASLKPLLDRVRSVLQEQVQEVRLSDRLTDSPCCLVVPEGANHAFLERVLKTHGHKVAPSKRILEVNGEHPLVKSLKALFERDPAGTKITEWIEMLYDQALLTEGSPLDDPNRFARRLTALMEQAAAQAERG